MKTITLAKFLEALKHCEYSVGALASGISMTCTKQLAEGWARTSAQKDVAEVLPVKAHCAILDGGNVVAIGVSPNFTGAMEVVP